MIELYKPKIEDLWFRQKFMSDEDTMSYNHAWGGTISFPESEWKDWYDIWVLCDDGTRFYRYLKEHDSGDFVGEIAYHLDTDRVIWVADVIIASEYRGRGYGRQGLRMLCEIAKANGIKVLCDDIAIDNPAIPLFEKNGFTEEYRTDDYVLLKKDLKENQMKVTKEYRELMYYLELPERFRAGDFGITEEEEAILREFVDNFYDSVKTNGYVCLEDFTEFMDFLRILIDADTEAVQLILTEAFMKSAEIRNDLRKR